MRTWDTAFKTVLDSLGALRDQAEWRKDKKAYRVLDHAIEVIKPLKVYVNSSPLERAARRLVKRGKRSDQR